MVAHLIAFGRMCFIERVMSGVPCPSVKHNSVRTAFGPSVCISSSVYAYLPDLPREGPATSFKNGTLFASSGG